MDWNSKSYTHLAETEPLSLAIVDILLHTAVTHLSLEMPNAVLGYMLVDMATMITIVGEMR
jgi:hypothetical protein